MVSRRRVLKASLAATGTLLASQDSGRVQGKRVFALIGDRYHNPDYIRVALERVFEPLGLKADYSIQYDALSGSLLKNYQLLLILRDGMIWPDGYLGPDAYTAYEQSLENKSEFPPAKPKSW